MIIDSLEMICGFLYSCQLRLSRHASKELIVGPQLTMPRVSVVDCGAAIRPIIRRECLEMQAYTAWLSASCTASLQRSALVVTRQARDLICSFEQFEFVQCPDGLTRDSGWSIEEIVWLLVRHVGIR